MRLLRKEPTSPYPININNLQPLPIHYNIQSPSFCSASSFIASPDPDPSSSGSAIEPGNDDPDMIGRTCHVATPTLVVDATAAKDDSPNTEVEHHRQHQARAMAVA